MEGSGSDMEVCADLASDGNYFDASFFVDESYVTREYGIGPHAIKVLCLQCSSTDYDLTGQLVWPGAELLNDYLITHSDIIKGLSVIELGSGVGLTGLLCARYCRHVVMTDHNTTVLKVMERNVQLQASNTGGTLTSSKIQIECEELEWGNCSHLEHIKEKYPLGFDLILGADICYQQGSIPPLFATVNFLMGLRPVGTCKFVLGYVSRLKSNDAVLKAEAVKNKMQLLQVDGTKRSLAGGAHEGCVYDLSLRPD